MTDYKYNDNQHDALYIEADHLTNKAGSYCVIAIVAVVCYALTVFYAIDIDPSVYAYAASRFYIEIASHMFEAAIVISAGASLINIVKAFALDDYACEPRIITSDPIYA